MLHGITGARLVRVKIDKGEPTHKVAVNHSGGTYYLTNTSDNIHMHSKEAVIAAINRSIARPSDFAPQPVMVPMLIPGSAGGGGMVMMPVLQQMVPETTAMHGTGMFKGSDGQQYAANPMGGAPAYYSAAPQAG